MRAADQPGRVTRNAAQSHLHKLEDYRPPDWTIDETSLDIQIDGDDIRVRSELVVRRHPAGDAASKAIILDGQGLELLEVQVDSVAADFSLSEDGTRLTVRCPVGDASAADFTLCTLSRFRPSANTDLMGLYLSEGLYCTQCEAEGFRRITWYLDRPDVLSRFRVRIEAGPEQPVLLAGGNLLQSGPVGEAGRHYALWEDPHPKPCYLFALVAGNLEYIEREFITRSQRRVALRLYAAPGQCERLNFALQALTDAMRWDEERYGREYDLDLFQIVAVDDFNFGAMENKGLNIFNAAALYATPELTTDAGYRMIRAIVAHEYFHNWSGNRVTLRDWFQLCLKEGFTVFRDQSFSCDLEGAGVERIRQVRDLRQRQFREDAGPLAHPVRPSRYRQIDNFYTSTVYEKGAEVVRMLAELLGAASFRSACDLYFDECDGTAATVEDFLRCMQTAAGRDLSGFMRWYAQKGTPKLRAEEQWRGEQQSYALTLSQSAPAVAAGAEPVPVPVRVAFYGSDGRKLPCQLQRAETAVAVNTDEDNKDEQVLELVGPEQTFVFTGLQQRPIPSLLRGFSAPVLLQHCLDEEQLGLLARCDDDPFRRWEAAQEIYALALADLAAGRDVPQRRLQALQRLWGEVLQQPQLDDALRSVVLTLPAPALAFDWSPPRPESFHRISSELNRLLAKPHLQLMQQCREQRSEQKQRQPYDNTPAAMGRREFRNWLLYHLTLSERQPGAWHEQCLQQVLAADNLTDRLGGLRPLLESPCGQDPAQQALDGLHTLWCGEPLLLDRWFAAQAQMTDVEALERVQRLTGHDAFGLSNPNRVRALLGTAAANGALFHRTDGEGYRWLAGWLERLDGVNPSVAARLCGAFSDCGSLEPQRRQQAQRILSGLRTAGVSSQLDEQLERILSGLDAVGQTRPGE